MIIDAHCHAWARWPYQPPVPDPATRGSMDMLVFEMDQAGVDRAVIICAGIDHNPENNDYVAAHAARHGGRIIPFADVDSRWSATHQTPGAAARLARTAERLKLVGFTHYHHEAADAGWLVSEEGLAFARVAADMNLILSLACGPSQMPVVRDLARRFPGLPILIHHLGRVRGDFPEGPAQLAELVAAAAEPNIIVKFSGFGHGVAKPWDYPYPSMIAVARALHAAYGAERMCWGSDYPVVRRAMTYRQSLEIVRDHCDFLSTADKAMVLGGTMARLLAARGA